METEAFLSHDWGKDHENHRKVAVVNSFLRKKGLVTWFDEEQLPNLPARQGIASILQRAIDATKCVVLFLTESYMNRVCATDRDDDYCRIEFQHAINQRKEILMVVMEKKMANKNKWPQPFSRVIHDRFGSPPPFTDLSSLRVIRSSWIPDSPSKAKSFWVGMSAWTVLGLTMWLAMPGPFGFVYTYLVSMSTGAGVGVAHYILSDEDIGDLKQPWNKLYQQVWLITR